MKEKRLIDTLMISTSYPSSEKDWKGVFISNLVNSISKNDSVDLKYWGPPGVIPLSATYACTEEESRWLGFLSYRGGIAHVIREGKIQSMFDIYKLLKYLYSVYRRTDFVDLYHVNWIQNAIPLLRSKKPALVTVLGSDFGLLDLPGMVPILRFVLNNRKSVLCPNAEWMKDRLEHLFGDIATIIPVPFGVDDAWFNVRRSFSAEDTKKWVVVSRLTEKKIGTLFEWGRDFFSNHPEHELHLFGPMQENLKVPDWIHYHGPTNPEELRTKWFPQSCGLITLSLHDEGRPQVILEAMASGLPVLASDLPAHTNFLVQKETGVIVRSEAEYISGLEWLSDHRNNEKLSNSSNDWVRREIGTWDDCASRYIEIYNKILDGKV